MTFPLGARGTLPVAKVVEQKRDVANRPLLKRSLGYELQMDVSIAKVTTQLIIDIGKPTDLEGEDCLQTAKGST